jgi:hypothetical protein
MRLAQGFKKLLATFQNYLYEFKAYKSGKVR